jgi:hypothetical protein
MKTRMATPSPPTLALLARGVSAISGRCERCGWRREIELTPLLDQYGDTLLPDFARRLCCGSWGNRELEARPAWRDPAAAPR